jgi:hypothetical protein
LSTTQSKWAPYFTHGDRTSLWRELPEEFSSNSTTPKAELMLRQLDSNTRKEKESLGLAFRKPETSTEQIPLSDQLSEQIENLFLAASEGFYEDEESRNFSEKLSRLVRLYGDAAIIGIAPFIIGDRANAEVASATLNCLSHLEGRVSYNFRIWLMERALQSHSSWIRDVAASSLESMDDPTAIPYLQEALSKESNPELRRYLRLVLEYLQRKR